MLSFNLKSEQLFSDMRKNFAVGVPNNAGVFLLLSSFLLSNQMGDAYIVMTVMSIHVIK